MATMLFSSSGLSCRGLGQLAQGLALGPPQALQVMMTTMMRLVMMMVMLMRMMRMMSKST